MNGIFIASTIGSLRPSVMVPLPVVCPYCGDTAIESLPEAQLIAMNVPHPHVVSRAQTCRCSSWHIFAVFPDQFNLQESNANQPPEENHLDRAS
jgi:hypothetical protein